MYVERERKREQLYVERAIVCRERKREQLYVERAIVCRESNCM